MNICFVRRRGSNIGDEAINFALRLLLRETLPAPLNLVELTPVSDPRTPIGLQASTVHALNQLAHGVVLGGGNVYESGQLDVDLNALSALRPPLLLGSLSYGRIYGERRRLVRRTDSMPDDVVVALNRKAFRSVARDDATLAYLRSLGIERAVLGGCPTLLLPSLLPSSPATPSDDGPVLLSIRNPAQMNISLAEQARVPGDIRRLVEALEAEGIGPVMLLCHDTRDLPFAVSFGDLPYLVPDDIHSYLELVRSARLIVTFRLHAFIPAVAFGVHSVNLSYDERSLALVRTLGLADWDIDYLGSPDIIGAVLDRAWRPAALNELVAEAQPRWSELGQTMRDVIGEFAFAATEYADRSAAPLDALSVEGA